MLTDYGKKTGLLMGCNKINCNYTNFLGQIMQQEMGNYMYAINYAIFSELFKACCTWFHIKKPLLGFSKENSNIKE